ncbi:manganese efflux pump MntP [Bacillus benzoevorans]|uniref:Putative manganese efflux pump MntP n=1 Tax=Bacillus benzoevorans TaxID=1456 RepID=A0A7X0HP52_9BACI|nr:manganese efflux pump MntP family protein [Bacillus benzoevorans]MBB6444288.1 putative Mn2+ efflux pump MntP [Bacillus benzoevorans]
MGLIELFLIAIGVSMDAFAASICRGLSLKKFNIKTAVIVGLYFGSFQAVMPLLGYLLGVQFQDLIEDIDHWIAFALLVIIGINFIRESRKECANNEENHAHIFSPLSFKIMFVLAFSTSIDALAVGVSFAFLKVYIVPAILFIGLVTFFMSIIGVKIGNTFGTKFKASAEFAGGVILILIGIHILLEHLGIIRF